MDRNDWDDLNRREAAWERMEAKQSQHTPGPWRSCPAEWWTIEANRYASHDEPLATVHIAAGRKEEAQANARLMVASPALADALREIIRRAPATEPEYDDWGGDTEDAETWGQSAGLWEAAQIAREALRKAGLDD